jgi:molecular chaperone DnaK
MMLRTIGIDLGTSNSAAATLINGKVRLIPPSDGPTPYGNLFPSVVAFSKDGSILVGKKAEAYSYVHPDRVVKWIKRRMGTEYTVDIDGRGYTPLEISAMILTRIRDDAEKYLGEKVETAVITAPAYFNNNQRNATKEAGELAGLDVMRVISEPTAASLAYGLDKIKGRLKIAMLDLGAGTFDVSILHMSGGIFKVISTSGDTQLGGKDMDDCILSRLVKRFEQEHRVDLRDEGDLSRLRDLAERAKIELSTKLSTTINFPLKKDGAESNLRTTLTRGELEDLVSPIIYRMEDPVEQALKDAGLSPHDTDRLVLVGGPTRMPIVWNHFKNFFGIEPEKGFHPMEIVAAGAYIYASILSGEIRDLLLMDVTPLSLGVETAGGVFTRLIKRNTTIPTEESMVFATEDDDQTSMIIHVLQGERAMAYDNVSLGLFRLDGIPPAPRYDQEIEVTFRIDADGILNVTAEILATGMGQEITVTEATALTEDEVVRRILEASRFGEEDEKRRRIVKVQNRIRAVLHALKQSTMKEMGGELSGDERRSLSKLLDKMREDITLNDEAEVMVDIDLLTKFMNRTKTRLKKVRHARMLASFIKRSVEDKISTPSEERLDTRVARLGEAKAEEVEAEINRLKELIMLSEADGGG